MSILVLALVALSAALWLGRLRLSARGTAAVRVQHAVEKSLRRTQRQWEAAGLISQLESLRAGEVEAGVREVTELAAGATGCERVNVWLFNEDETELHCVDLYESSRTLHSSGMVLCEPDFRNEFQALKDARYVDADDPLTDPRTVGYTDVYLRPLRITSMLDAVIRVSGRNLGLLCFEHVDTPHRWEPDEISFACQLADKIGLSLLTRTRLQSEQSLRESEAALADAQALAHLGSWQFDLSLQTVTWSAEMYRIFGVDPATFVPSIDAVLARTHPDDRARVGACRDQALAGQVDYAIDHRVVLDDGTVRHVHERGRFFGQDAGRLDRAVGTVQDITERKRTEDTLLFANTLLTTEMETSPDGILVVDDTGRVRLCNRRFAQMWGLAHDVLLSGDDALVLAAVTSQVVNPDAFTARVEQLYQHPWEEGHDELETIDGRFIDRHTASLQPPSGRSLGRVWYFRDITDRKRAEAEIRHSATHDALTGLPNRAVFTVAVGRAMAHVRRAGTSIALLSIDLDHFKDVNDTLGHLAGDELLQQVAVRLRASCRGDDTVARFGGDEFAVVASDLSHPDDAAVLADALLAATREPFHVQGNDVRTNASVGIATFAGGPEDAEELLSHADVALYRAKAEGRGMYRFFTDVMDRDLRTRVTLGAQLRAAIPGGQLFLLYQPQVHAHTGRITGAEALVRWRHPERGLLEPGLFIPIAEQSGLIAALSLWVLRESCRQARIWLDAGFALEHVAVNLSALQFKAPFELERDVVSILEATGVPAERLELEITETALMVASREDEHHDVLSRLRARGIRLAIDDFGTGYSSLDYLRRFPVDRIKIPQAFVAQVTQVGGSTAIVKATIGLARELGIAVIAEGVESEQQLRLLRSWGCQAVQGYYFAPPLTADALTSVLEQGERLMGDEPAATAASLHA